jgi:hypothetical protein
MVQAEHLLSLLFQSHNPSRYKPSPAGTKSVRLLGQPTVCIVSHYPLFPERPARLRPINERNVRV